MLRLSGKWNTFLQHVPESDLDRLAELSVRIDPNEGHIMPGDTVRLKLFSPREPEQETLLDLALGLEGAEIATSRGTLKFPIIGLLPRAAAQAVAKVYGETDDSDYTSVTLSVASRGPAYAPQSGPTKGQVEHTAQIEPSATPEARMRRKRQAFIDYGAKFPVGEVDSDALNFYYSELEKNLDQYSTPEALWDEARKRKKPPGPSLIPEFLALANQKQQEVQDPKLPEARGTGRGRRSCATPAG